TDERTQQRIRFRVKSWRERDHVEHVKQPHLGHTHSESVHSRNLFDEPSCVSHENGFPRFRIGHRYSDSSEYQTTLIYLSDQDAQQPLCPRWISEREDITE